MGAQATVVLVGLVSLLAEDDADTEVRHLLIRLNDTTGEYA